jgi:hypothetical protein
MKVARYTCRRGPTHEETGPLESQRTSASWPKCCPGLLAPEIEQERNVPPRGSAANQQATRPASENAGSFGTFFEKHGERRRANECWKKRKWPNTIGEASQFLLYSTAAWSARNHCTSHCHDGPPSVCSWALPIVGRGVKRALGFNREDPQHCCGPALINLAAFASAARACGPVTTGGPTRTEHHAPFHVGPAL